MTLKANSLRIPTAEVFEPLLAPARYKGAWGGRGCLHPEALIDTPHGQTQISDFKGGEVYSWHNGRVVRAEASAAREYTVEDLFEVTLADGRSIVATDQHKFLTPRGWLPLASLSKSDAVVVLREPNGLSLRPTILGNGLSTYGQDAPHWRQTREDYLGNCSEYLHQYGQRLLSEANSGLTSSPSPSDGRQHSTRASSHWDGQAFACMCNHSSALSRRSTSVALASVAVQCCAIWGNRIAERIFERLWEFFQWPQQFLPICSHCAPFQELSALPVGCGSAKSPAQNRQMLRGTFQPGAFGSPSWHDPCERCGDFTISAVKGIRNHSRRAYWDLHVWGVNNYLSGGIVNHNSGKSHFFAGLMAEDHFANPGFRSVCIREVQKTLQQSAKRLIEDKLAEFKLGEAQGFKVFREVIETPGDGLIIFQGMQDHTADSIKSFEGFDRAWVEEAQSLSHRSLTLLRPTLRKKGSQIWFSWNPRNEFDAVDQFLRKKPPEGSLVVRANWSDNPWFTDTLEDERLHDKASYPELYDNVWEGAYSDDASQIFIPARLVLEAEKSTVEPSPSATVVWGLDVGRQGDDSALCKRRGNALLEPVKAFHRPDTMQVVSFVLSELLQTAHHAPDRFPKMLVIDANGMGWGVFDRLRQIQRENTRHAEGVDIPNLKNLRIVDLNVSKAPTIKQAVRSLRDELWYKGREWLESGIANLPDDPELRRELTSVRYAEDSSGRIQIESKKDAAKRGIDSWNRADAFLLTFGGGADSVTASKNSYGAPINYPKTRGYV